MRVIGARQAISRACRNGSRRPVPRRAVLTLVQVHGAGPDDIFRYGSGTREMTMSALLEEQRDVLSRCGRREQAAALDRALAGS